MTDFNLFTLRCLCSPCCQLLVLEAKNGKLFENVYYQYIGGILSRMQDFQYTAFVSPFIFLIYTACEFLTFCAQIGCAVSSSAKPAEGAGSNSLQ